MAANARQHCHRHAGVVAEPADVANNHRSKLIAIALCGQVQQFKVEQVKLQNSQSNVYKVKAIHTSALLDRAVGHFHFATVSFTGL